MSGEQKEQWARIRYGNIGKWGKKGYINRDCGVCGVEKENLEHIWQCEEARKEIKKEWIEGVDKWRGGMKGDDLTRWMVDTLKGELLGEMCKYIRAFNNLKKSGIRVRANGGESEEGPSQG